MNPKRKNKSGETHRAAAVFSQLGVRMAACVFIGFGAAKLLTSRFGAPSWVFVLGVLLGVGAAYKTLYDLVKEWLQ